MCVRACVRACVRVQRACVRVHCAAVRVDSASPSARPRCRASLSLNTAIAKHFRRSLPCIVRAGAQIRSAFRHAVRRPMPGASRSISRGARSCDCAPGKAGRLRSLPRPTFALRDLSAACAAPPPAQGLFRRLGRTAESGPPPTKRLPGPSKSSLAAPRRAAPGRAWLWRARSPYACRFLLPACRPARPPRRGREFVGSRAAPGGVGGANVAGTARHNANATFVAKACAAWVWPGG